MDRQAIQVIDLKYSVRSGFFMRPKLLLDNINISVPKGSSMGFIGPNGAGKTTTIKLISGILRPKSGNVLLYGRPATDPDARKKIALLTENQYLPPYLKLKEWLELLGHLSGIAGSSLRKKVWDMMELFELKEYAGSQIHTLSKGQKQRAGFAQVFLHSPNTMILDEPMSGMDPKWRNKIKEMLFEFKNNGGTLFFSSHIMSDIMRLSDQIIMIKSGKIKWQGSMQDINRSSVVYQSVFHTGHIDRVKKLLEYKHLESQPDGSFLIAYTTKQKKQFLELATKGEISILSIVPIYPELEEMFK
jgi:ABC-2 type transport system ATP-binding protein